MHFDSHWSSILDQFVSNIPEFVQNCEVDTPLLTNDHCTVSITLRFKIFENSTNRKTNMAIQIR